MTRNQTPYYFGDAAKNHCGSHRKFVDFGCLALYAAIKISKMPRTLTNSLSSDSILSKETPALQLRAILDALNRLQLPNDRPSPSPLPSDRDPDFETSSKWAYAMAKSSAGENLRQPGQRKNDFGLREDHIDDLSSPRVNCFVQECSQKGRSMSFSDKDESVILTPQLNTHVPSSANINLSDGEHSLLKCICGRMRQCQWLLPLWNYF